MLYDSDVTAWDVFGLLFWITIPFWMGLIPGVLLGKLWPRLGGFDGAMIGFAVGFTVNAVSVGVVLFVLVTGIRLPVSLGAYGPAPAASLAAMVGICWWNGCKAKCAD